MDQWNKVGKPIVVLASICVAVTTALALTNQATAPIIAARLVEEANAARKELMPNAPSFEEIKVNVSNVTEVYKATDESGYIVTATSKGYGGSMSVMVAFDQEGAITRVKIQEHAETVGIGTKVEEESFWGQYTGKNEGPLTLNVDIDKVASATISSNAVNNAVNTAFEGYKAAVMGSDYVAPTEIVTTDMDVLQELLPDVTEFVELDVSDIADVVSAYGSSDESSYVLFTEGMGYASEMSIAIAFDADGTVLKVTLGNNDETEGIGSTVSDESFMSQFVGRSEAFDFETEIDAISGATVSSSGVSEAVNKAISGFAEVKQAEILGIVIVEESSSEDSVSSGDEFAKLRAVQREKMISTMKTFEEIDISYLDIENLVEVFQSTDGEGYVFTTRGMGYYDLVDMLVAMDLDGNILKVEQHEPDPSPYTQEFRENDVFFHQYVGMSTEVELGTDIDAVSGSTVSSSAVTDAVNVAIVAFEAVTNMADYAGLRADQREKMISTMTTFEEVDSSDFNLENLVEVFQSTDGDGYVFSTRGMGYHGLIDVLVAMDLDGNILKVEQHEPEPSPYSQKFRDNEEFFNQYQGVSKEVALHEDIDAVSGSTVSSSAITEGVNIAIEAFAIVKERTTDYAALRAAQREKMISTMRTFEEIDSSEFNIENLVEVFQATDGDGYVFSTQGMGYHGLVDVLVAMDLDGNILKVEQHEAEPSEKTQKFRDNEEFFNQYKGISEEVELEKDIDAVSGSTVSSSAVNEGVNVAIEAFAVVQEQSMKYAALRAAQREKMISTMTKFKEVDISKLKIENLVEVFQSTDGDGYVFSTRGMGYHGLVDMLVAMDLDGNILKVEQHEAEPSEKTQKFRDNEEFFNQYKGISEEVELEKDIDAVSGSTVSSSAVNEGVNVAIAAYDALH